MTDLQLACIIMVNVVLVSMCLEVYVVYKMLTEDIEG